MMRRVDTVVQRLMPVIANKRILEPACGCAEFSIAAARHAQEVFCFDLDDRRLRPDQILYLRSLMQQRLRQERK